MGATQNVPVPLGAGLNRGPDPEVLPPQFAATAENLVVRQGGGYQKTPGSTYDNLSPAGSGLLIPHSTGDLLFAGVRGGYARSPNIDWRDQHARNSPHPLKVTFQSVLNLPGEVSQFAIAHNAGYTAIACRHRPRITTARHTVWAILDSDNNVVGGPWVSTDVKEYPRIEPITVAATPYFVFMGLTKNVDGTLDPFPIVAARVNATSPPSAGSITIGLAIGTANLVTGHTKGRLIYDSHSDPTHDKAYIVYHDGTNVVARRTDGDTTDAAVIVFNAASHFAVFHHKLSETVLVYQGATGDIHYANSALSSFASVAGGVTSDHPVWYYSVAEGNLFMDGMDVDLAGSNPGTPSHTGSRQHTPSGKVYDPQGWFEPQTRGDGDTVFFSAYNPTVADRRKAPPQLDAVFTLGDESFTYAPIGSTRFLGPIFDGETQNGASANVFVQPQSAKTTDGRVLVPVSFGTPAAQSLPVVDSGSGSISDEGDVGPFDGYAPNNDRTVGFATLDPRQAQLVASSAPHDGSTVIAAGNVGVWDGLKYFDLLDIPKIVDYDDANPPTLATGPNRNTIGQLDKYQIAEIAGGTYTHINWWAMRIVLVYTDRNGVEYRSAPSAYYAQEDIANGEATSCPVIEIGLNDSHRRILKTLETDGDAVSFDVEVYVTARDDGLAASDGTPGAASELEIVHEYYLCQRVPLLQTTVSGVDRYYIFDLLTASFQGLSLTDNVSVPLYTDQNELAPLRPPASNVLAHAGNYLFLLPSERPTEIWPTKPLERGRGPEWAPELVVAGPSGGGNVVSLAGQGDRLLVLCERGVWELFAGQGPDANGDGSFGNMRDLMADGCVDHRGTVSTPDGVVYLARSGPKLVRNGGEVVDIGKALQGVFDPANIRSSTYHREAREVWLAFTTGVAVYNLAAGAWTTQTGVYDSLAYSGSRLYKRVASNSDIAYESTLLASATTESHESGSYFLGKYVSPWLSLGDMSASRCVRWIALRLRCIGTPTAGQIHVKFAYDYNTSDVETYTTSAARLDVEDRIRIKPARQRFQAVRVTVEEATTNAGEGPDAGLIWALTGLTLEVENRNGLARLDNTAPSGHTLP